MGQVEAALGVGWGEFLVHQLLHPASADEKLVHLEGWGAARHPCPSELRCNSENFSLKASVEEREP